MAVSSGLCTIGLAASVCPILVFLFRDISIPIRILLLLLRLLVKVEVRQRSE